MDIVKLTAFEMKKKLQEKEISSRELVEAHFNNIDEDLNTFISLNKEEALKSADRVDKKIKNNERIGLLAGLPIGLKDNIMTKGLRTTAGSKMLADFIPPYDAEIVSRIKDAEGIIIGKTNMNEFGIGSSTETSYFGPSKRPLDGDEGISEGSAAAVKANEVALAVGTDTGGSLRQPASFTDLVGITASYGIISRYGILALADTLDQVGVFGKDVADAVLILSSITGYDEKDSTSFNNPEGTIIFQNFKKNQDYKNYLKGMKIGLPKEFFDLDFDEKIKKQILKSVEIFKVLGAEIEEISLPSLKYALATYNILSSAEISSNLARFDGIRYGYRAEEYNTLDELYIKTRTQGFGDKVKRSIILGTYYLSNDKKEEYYIKALKARSLIKEDFDKAFNKYDVILSPSLPISPEKLKENTSDNYKADIFTVAVNLAGLCAMTIPCGHVEGLPLGLQIMGDRFKEANIIKAGIGFEGGIKNGL